MQPGCNLPGPALADSLFNRTFAREPGNNRQTAWDLPPPIEQTHKKDEHEKDDDTGRSSPVLHRPQRTMSAEKMRELREKDGTMLPADLRPEKEMREKGKGMLQSRQEMQTGREKLQELQKAMPAEIRQMLPAEKGQITGDSS